MVEALGIAGSQSAGLFAFMANGVMTKVLHAGKAAQSGILSAYLVKEGFIGPTTVLEDSRYYIESRWRQPLTCDISSVWFWGPIGWGYGQSTENSI